METAVNKPLKRFFGLLRLEKNNVYYIYFYSIISGLLYLSLPLGIQAIISLMFAQQISASLILLIVLVIAGVFLNGFMYILQMRVTERIQVRLFTLISLAYSDRLPKLQEEAINDYHLPELVNRFFDTTAIQKGISKVLLEFPVAMVQIFFGLTLLSLYHPIFIFFGFILVSLLYLVIRFTAPQGMSSSFEESDFKYKVGYWIEEIARNIKTFKLRGETDLAINKTNEYLDGYLKARNRHFTILQIQFWSFTFFKTAVTAVLLITGCWLFFENKINIGQFIATEIVIIMTLSSVEKIITSIDGVYDLLTSLEKASKILDKPIESINNNTPQNFDKINIDIHHLSFNLVVGISDCTLEDIMNIADEINLKDFIAKHKDGIYQQLSTHGKRLSESTRAKILLARAILKKPKVLLLDDFTYLLTKRDKNIIINYLFNTQQPYSIFIKTSDEEIMKKCDRVLFMHEGRIIADGSFEQIASSNEYKIISDEFYEMN